MQREELLGRRRSLRKHIHRCNERIRALTEKSASSNDWFLAKLGKYRLPFERRQKVYDEQSKIYRAKDEIRSINEKLRKLRSKVVTPTDDRTEHEALEEIHSKERQPHNKGWHNLWKPSRERYWRPNNNNWKRHRKTRYHAHI